MKDLAEGPLHMVQLFNGYVINGYKFHTEEYGSNKSTINTGVCIKGSSHSADNIDYYGRLIEILQLQYNALPFKLTVLFKCSWFDPTPKHASQVYSEMYPTVKKTVSEWLAICPIKAHSVLDIPKKVEQPHTLNVAFQEDDSQIHEIDIDENEILNTLNDLDGMFIDMEEGEEEDEKEVDKDEDEDEDEDEDKDGDEDNDEDEDKEEDDDHDHDDDDNEKEKEEDGKECELHKKKRRRI
ncbi:pheromone-processing carboxypeptidase KEX1-like [Capsicum annuum]|uniref:pheromone-processing carboxypeptidase KEX1-like n=1 Tax=Capsicum annuum TaxID=4072 RepID=UPI001FB07C1F|nr:pheromone-processing carboxypeptidase KEX1-like [Capsicum annuum]